ncbi:hypothetical protein [Nocardia huaxiensis]|uniref:hypothetical protein n=1 Tax=Nocardia huaxiensis TaxID=2755382 RepID=UPI001E2AE8E8|nr:hypothetical protein [Nocardia huaxiensis]UFS96356.1 hypothetical protein LPY97_37980 [Nocardia huaxiensis]
MPTFQTPAPIAVTVDLPIANVVVLASDRADTVVEVRPADATKKDDVRIAEKTRVGFTDGELTVDMPTSRRLSPFGGKGAIEVRIEVPAGSRLRGVVAMGRLTGVGEFGECDLEVSAGDIVVERPHGSVTARTAKGDIRVDAAARGVLDLATQMGELEVGIVPGSAVQLASTTLHGAVQNQLAPATRSGEENTVRVNARTSYGNIIVRQATAA